VLTGAKGFARIQALADATDAVTGSLDEGRRRFEIMARQVFIRFKALVTEPVVFQYAERHDNIEAIYKTLQERRDTSDVTDLLKELHRIVNQAIRAQQQPAGDDDPPRQYDLSQVDLEKLRNEFAKKVKRKAATLQDIRQVVEDKLAQMLQQNPQRMDYYRKYSEIIADYNREKDRVTIEDTFARLVDLVNSLDAEQRRAAEEGLSEDELALFDLLQKDNITRADGRDTGYSDPIPAAGEAAPGGRGVRQGIRHQAGESSRRRCIGMPATRSGPAAPAPSARPSRRSSASAAQNCRA
jgi:type I restriction enzyme R subunit